jgi:hypothetical protein
LGVRSFLPRETQAHRGDGIYGIDADRGRYLASHPLRRGIATARARRLFHRRFSASPYNPETFEVTDEFDYAAKVLDRLARDFDFKNRWAYCARYLPGNPTAGFSLKKSGNSIATPMQS